MKTSLLPKTDSILKSGAIVVSLLASSSMALETVSGTVYDASTGNPTSGAIISINGGAIIDTSDELGNFSITSEGTAIHTVQKQSPRNLGTIFQDGAIRIETTAGGTAMVEVFGLNGRKIGSIEQAVSVGSTNFAPIVSTPGVYIYRIILNGEQFTTRCIHSGSKSGIAGTVSSLIKSSYNTPVISQQETLQRGKRTLRSGESVFLSVSKPGFVPDTQTVLIPSKNLQISLSAVNLPSGVKPGKWEIAAGTDTLGGIYVNQSGTTVDSLRVPIRLQCISTDYTMSQIIHGPFAIPRNGVITSGDSLQICFTGSSVTGTYQSTLNQSVANGIACTWRETYYSAGGSIQIVTEKHYSHQFNHKDPAEFTSDFYELTLNADGGTIYPSSKGSFFKPFEQVDLVAIPDSGKWFSGWNGLNDTTSQLTVIMDGSKTVTANFKNNYILTASATPLGFYSIEPSKDSYKPGTVVKLVTKTGYSSETQKMYGLPVWSGTTDSTKGDTAWITMNSDMTVSAACREVYALGVIGSSFKIEIDPNQRYFEAGKNDTAKIIITPDSGFHLFRWQDPKQLIRSNGDTAFVLMNTSKTIKPLVVSDKIFHSYNYPGNQSLYYQLSFTDSSDVVLYTDTSACLFDKISGNFTGKIDPSQEYFSTSKKQYSRDYVRSAEYSYKYNMKTPIAVFDVASGSKLRVFDSIVPDFSSLQISQNGTKIAYAGSKGKICIGDVANGTFVVSEDTIFRPAYYYKTSVNFAENDSVILIGSGYGDSKAVFTRISATTGKTMSQLTVPEFVSPEVITFSQDRKTAFIGTWNRDLQIYDVATGALLDTIPMYDPVQEIVCSPDDNWILVGMLGYESHQIDISRFKNR